MIISNVRKYAVVFFAVVLMSSIAIPQAYAQTTPATQQQIAQLLAQIAALRAQLAALTGGTVGVCTAQFSRDLSIGASGADVLALQKLLNRSADTQLAVSGAGSPGLETQYYGPITAGAVSKFQVKYRSEILTPSGIVNPTGYFGPASRAKANALCSVTVSPTTPPVTPPADDDDELEGGEASLENFEVEEGDDTTLSEGQNNALVADISFDVEDGDVMIDRIDVAFDHITGGDDDPWDVFEDVSIWVDDEKVASMDVSDDSVWSEDTPNSGDYRLRLSGIDHIVREGDAAELTVAVTVSDNVDDAGSVEWELLIPDDGVRVSDSLDLSHTTGDESQTVSFEINEAGQGSDLVVKTSDEDPEASILQVERNNTSDWMTVFAFELDADDSDADIDVSSITLDVDVSDTETYDGIVRDAMLVVDGEEYDDVSISNGTTDTATLTFDLDDELAVGAGEEVTVELQLQFKALAASDEGTTVMASISSAQADLIEAEGVDDLSDSQISGSAQGEEHELRTGGSNVGAVETSAELKTNSNSTQDDDEGVFTIEFDVTAFEQDVYVNESLARGTAQGTEGINYLIEDGQGDTIATGDIGGAILDSTADKDGDRYRIDEGQTETFTVVVEFDPATSGFYQLQLYSINYNDTESDPDTYQRTLPESTYETEPLSI
jgi:peptidoglycan hydrolase-like protein with peptidoglycan-binding domain